MTILKSELKRGRTSLILWTSAIVIMIIVCIGMFPDISKQSDTVEQMFSQLGNLSSAFGMDRISMSDPLGFYGIECGNMLGIGGALFAAILGVSALAGEEKNRTVEFLLTHPIRRTKIVCEKLIYILINLVVLNASCAIIAYLGYMAIGEKIDIARFLLMHLAYFLTQLELAAICFGLSAWIRNSNMGIGVGIAMLAYMLNLIANLTSKVDFLKYVTPFGYSEAADIIANCSIDAVKVTIGMAVSLIAVIFAFCYYNVKNIHA